MTAARPVVLSAPAADTGQSRKIVVMFFLILGFIGVVYWIAVFGNPVREIARSACPQRPSVPAR